MDKEKLIKALKKRAFGYTVSERSTEYDSEGNEIKNKVTTKEVSPDLSAIKMLLELGVEEELDEKQLEEERDRLLQLLAQTKKKKKEKD
ncbi:MAG: hypothetical protein IJX05_06125 [Clostridia bacterium]|nr:hypothetical protein [Clostridia bacterium]